MAVPWGTSHWPLRRNERPAQRPGAAQGHGGKYDATCFERYTASVLRKLLHAELQRQAGAVTAGGQAKLRAQGRRAR